MDANELRQDEDAALLLSALSSLGSADEAAELLLDLCTPREIWTSPSAWRLPSCSPRGIRTPT